jgi:hypothetical protein
MPLPLRLLCLLVLLLPVVVPAAASEPEPWRARIDVPDWQLHDVRARLLLASSEAGLRGGSRPHALRRIYGPWQALLAAIFRRDLHGTWLQLELGPADAQGLRHGTLRSVFTAALALECRGESALECELRDGERRFGRLQASRVDGTPAAHDYSTLPQRVEAALQAYHYAPERLQSPAWRRALARFARLAGKSHDDLDALAAWTRAARDLPDSHVRLMRSQAEATAPAAVAIEQAIALAWHDDVAQLTISTFGLDPAAAATRLQAVFTQIAARPARALVLDLRGNPGGNFSSMLVAGHLLAERTPAGHFLGRRWWDGHAALPSPAQAAALPLLADPDRAAFLAAMREVPGLRGEIEPRTPQFAGPVFVLIDGRSGSAAEPLAHLLRHAGRARLVGARSAGAMLASDGIELGDGWRLVVPVADYYGADGRRIEGVGVAPHVEVDPEQALQRALALARS